MIRWATWILVTLGGLVAVIALIGASLPKKHSASRTARVPLPPETLFSILADVNGYPTWRPQLKRLERLPDRHGLPAWVETTSTGRLPMAFERMERPGLLVGRITDVTLAFGGTWTYRIVPAAAGSELTITEDGEVYNPIFRFMSRFVFGHTATIDGFLADLLTKTVGSSSLASR